MSVIEIRRDGASWYPREKKFLSGKPLPGEEVRIEVENEVATCDHPCGLPGIRVSIMIRTQGGIRCRAATLDGAMSESSTPVDRMAPCGMIEQPR